jgi:acyl-CoA thioester hydrolase
MVELRSSRKHWKTHARSTGTSLTPAEPAKLHHPTPMEIKEVNEFTVTISPRLYETDALGHINNATIAAWFEVIRMRFLESLADTNEAHLKSWILASVQIDFIAETFYGSDVTGKVVDASIGNTSFTLHCEMWQGDKQTVRGKAVLVHMDVESHSPSRIPDLLREKLAAR